MKQDNGNKLIKNVKHLDDLFGIKEERELQSMASALRFEIQELLNWLEERLSSRRDEILMTKSVIKDTTEDLRRFAQNISDSLEQHDDKEKENNYEDDDGSFKENDYNSLIEMLKRLKYGKGA